MINRYIVKMKNKNGDYRSIDINAASQKQAESRAERLLNGFYVVTVKEVK